jgi:hypothetical protein
MTNEVWKTLSTINVNDKTEQKGNFTYLSWTFAWSKLMENYPDATHDMLDDVHYQDGTMEVRSSVTINGQTLKCFLPVIDHRNKAIQNPNAFDINKNRMRCLVKNIALFGLGIYIFSGQDLPEAPSEPDYTDAQREEYIALMAAGDGFGMKKFAGQVGVQVLTNLFNSAPKGQKTAHKDKYRDLVNEANAQLKATLAALEAAVAEQNPEHINEILDELTPVESEIVEAGINEVLMTQINQLIAE